MTDVLQCYRTFCRVAERGGLSRAAIDLDMAQASVSRHLQELERRYGTRLFQRTTRQIQLTPAGQRLLDYAQSVLASESQLTEALKLDQQQIEGPITLAASIAFGHELVGPFCMGFMQRYPGVRLKLQLQTRRADLVEEGIDLALRIGEMADSGLVATRLGELQEVLVAAPALFPRGRVPAQPEDLAPYPRLGRAEMPGGGVIRLLCGRKSRVLDAPPRFAADSYLVLRRALLAGAGYGVVHRNLVKEDLERRRLLELLPQWRLPHSPVQAVMPARQPAARVQLFVKEFGAYLQEVLR